MARCAGRCDASSNVRVGGRRVAVASELRAIPDVLSYVGTELANQARTLRGVQRACDRDVDGAQPGWVGTSGAALAELLNRWAAAGAGHLARLNDHADGIRFAAAGLGEMEQGNAASLR
ncbi:hypothetical protein EUA02_23750 [Mycobacterium paragordonae]|nr:hypothetical protein EUA02_23750 [Mycobacterium paragordonae]TDL03073.1 hypothetical protein EUA05_25505 [Mycobacterium paragordonae]